jgi:hypothetical protein
MDGGGDDVRRPVPGQLNDVLAQVRFDRLDSRCLQGVIQMDFFARHRLRLDDLGRLPLVNYFDNRAARFGPIVGKMHLAAAANHAFFERREVLIEIRQRLVFDRPRPLANQIRARQRLPCLAIASAQRIAQSSSASCEAARNS